MQHVAKIQQLCLNQGNNKAHIVDTQSVEVVSTVSTITSNLRLI